MKKVTKLFSLFLLLAVILGSCGPKMELIFIDSVKGIAKVRVALGTSEEDVRKELPGKVTITDNKGKNYDITASWTINGYDKDKEGTYSAKGSFTLPVGVSQKTPPVPLEVTVEIQVLKPELKSVTALNEKYYVSLGTAKATAMTKLPTSTTVKDELGGEYTVELKNWVCSTYNANSEADYPASATFDVPVQIKDNTEVSKTVNTMLSVSDKRTLKSIKPAKDITVSVNTYDSNQIKTVLDATTVITDTTDATHTVSLTWDVSSYDQTKTGEYTVSATFVLPANVENTVPPTELKVTAKITVANQQGSGTLSDPYIIENITQLLNVKNGLDKHYRMKENIKLVFESVTHNGKWEPIGTDAAPFTGTFDGNGSTVELQFISIDSWGGLSGTNIGMFGVIGSSGSVKNLNVDYIDCNGNENVGILAGKNEGRIENCSVKKVSNEPTTGIYAIKTVGLFVGYNSGEILNSTSSGKVVLANSSVGGFVGYNSGSIKGCAVLDGAYVRGYNIDFTGGFVGINSGSISESSSDIYTVDVSDENIDGLKVGGFVGKNESTGSISYCMSSGEVKGNSTVTKSAGFALENEGSIDKSYSRVTVLASSGKIFSFAPQDTGITDCYWVGSTSDHEQTSAVRLDDAAAKKPSSYANWVFGDKWFIDTGYPVLERTLPVKYEHGDGSLADPFVINNVAQLDAMRWRLSKHYVLAENIHLNDTWYPVGAEINGEVRYFTGSFDGNNKTIDNMRIGWTASGSGMFGYVDKAVIKNIKFTNAYLSAGPKAGFLVGVSEGSIASESPYSPRIFTEIDNIQILSGTISGSSEVGGLIGRGNKVELTNISVKADITGSEYVGGVAGYLEVAVAQDVSYEGQVTATKACGGIAGKFSGEYVSSVHTVNKNLTSKGVISGEHNVGGLIGEARGSYENVSSEAGILVKSSMLQPTESGRGGLFGVFFYGELKNSFYNGQITAEKGISGGLIGYAVGPSIVHCYSQGSITYPYGDMNGSYAGGIFGDGYASISESYSSCEIVRSNFSGGLVGRFKSNSYNYKIVNCYALGSAYAGLVYHIDKGRIENSYSIGTISYSAAGLVFKATTNSTALNSFWDTQASGATSTASCNGTALGTGKTTAEMKNQNTYTGWDFTNIWAIDSSKNNGYPYLK